ncbi:Peroxidase 60 [Linum grandiflorum]
MTGSAANYNKVITALLGLLLLGLAADQARAQLQFGFYKGKCRATDVDVESTVRRIVSEKYQSDKSIVAALLRMQFHDCFVQGCDASILLDGPTSEKTAPPNLSVRGYKIIDAVKTELEGSCGPQVVSCADIIVMATRDAVSLAKGGFYNVQTGRRDGLVSSAKNVALPAPNVPIPLSISMFGRKNLSPIDMVYLLGGHTVGVSSCAFFQDRLYNFRNSGRPDPSMNPTLLSSLRQTCPPNSNSANTTNLDQNPASSLIVDNSYYQQLLRRNGILQVDQDLASHPLTGFIVSAIANRADFSARFGQAMINLGAVDVLTGQQGQIRKSCRVVNN